MKKKLSNNKKMLMSFIFTFVILVLILMSSLEFFDKEEYSNYNPDYHDEFSSIKDNELIYNEDIADIQAIYVTIFKDNLYRNTELRLEDNFSRKKAQKIYFKSSESQSLQDLELIQEPNGTIEIKGQSLEDPQRSYKIRLFDKAGLWEDQGIINLNKHYSDELRIKNKLSMDYFSRISNITSFKTDFIRLFVNDQNIEKYNKYIDYGFFTHIEQPNKRFLENHKLDPNGQLYKAIDFNFSNKNNKLKVKGNNEYSKKNFEESLKIKGNNDHTKLIKFIEDVNNEDEDINEVIDKYMDRDNFLTWTAVNILFDHYSGMNKDYYLYSPLNSNKWYYMPWDYDKAWGRASNREGWRTGIYMYWENTLHRRFYSEPDNVEALKLKLKSLTKIVNKEKTEDFLDSYKNVLFNNLTKLPDFQYLKITFEDFEEQYGELSEITESNYLNFLESVQLPMPFLIHEPEITMENVKIKWESSSSLNKDKIEYNISLAKDPLFEAYFYEESIIDKTEFLIKNLEKGIYYLKITAKNNDGRTQSNRNIYIDNLGNQYDGVLEFVIN